MVAINHRNEHSNSKRELSADLSEKVQKCLDEAIELANLEGTKGQFRDNRGPDLMAEGSLAG